MTTGAELKLAIMCKEIVETPWWKFLKVTRLVKQAEIFAVKHGLDF